MKFLERVYGKIKNDKARRCDEFVAMKSV